MKNPEEDDSSKAWAWTLWNVEVPVEEDCQVEIVCKVSIKPHKYVVSLICFELDTNYNYCNCNYAGQSMLQYSL